MNKMGDAVNFATGMVIAGSILLGSNCVSCNLADQSNTLKYLNSNIGHLETTLQRNIGEQSTFTGTPEEKQIEGKLWMCVPREDYFRK